MAGQDNNPTKITTPETYKAGGGQSSARHQPCKSRAQNVTIGALFSQFTILAIYTSLASLLPHRCQGIALVVGLKCDTGTCTLNRPIVSAEVDTQTIQRRQVTTDIIDVEISQTSCPWRAYRWPGTHGAGYITATTIAAAKQICAICRHIPHKLCRT